MPDTAELQLERVLFILAAAALPGGAEEAELCAALEIAPGQAARDLAALADRAYYHPPGSAGAADILLSEGRVQVIPRGGHYRPTRLGPGEATALALGLRSMALEAGPERRARLLALGSRLERFAARATIGCGIAVAADLGGAGPVLDAVRRAAAERRRCRIRYLKPGRAPNERVVCPYVLVHAERWWYLLAEAGESGVRLFRLDRILTAELMEDRFAVPHDFDPARYLTGGRAFHSEADTPVAVVRYAPAAAPWAAERYPEAECGPDGSVTVKHPGADPEWVVSHVLQYGPDAELISPPDLRARLLRRLEETVGAWSDATA